MSWPAVIASGPSCPHPVMRAKISRGLTAAQSSGPMPSRSQVPGRKQSSSTSALAASSSSVCGCFLTSRSTMRLPRCSQVDVLGGHRQPAGPAHPHHVGAQVGEHHRRMRARADAAKLDHFHPGEGSRVGHGTQTSGMAETESKFTVFVAFAANLAIAVAKTVAAVMSGSASMAAEAAHSWADTGNQGFLIIANRRSSRPPDAERPLGYGAEAYVWSLLAAVGLFVVGGTVVGLARRHRTAPQRVGRPRTICRLHRAGRRVPARVVVSAAGAAPITQLRQRNTTETSSPTCWRRPIRPPARCSPRTPRH